MAFVTGTPGAYSARRLWWASQETINDWAPTSENSAGWLDLGTDGVLVCGHTLRGQTLIWTTTDLFALGYIGGSYLYSAQKVGSNCGIVSQHGFVALDTQALWWGVNQKFFAYDGFVKTIECDVSDYVFGSFNTSQASLVWALANPAFNEVTWFYPSAVATSCDRYVTYNYAESHWTYGTLQRSCGVSFIPGSTTTPVLIDSSGRIYDHETGNARTGQTIYLESGPMDVGSGERVVRAQRIVPDDKTVGDVSASLYTSLAPDDTETLNGPYTLTSITSVRLTARQVRLRLTEVAASAWRVGVVRLGGVLGGRR